MQDKSRKILILATSYLPLVGGAELAIKGLTDHLSDLSFDLVTARNTLQLPQIEKIGNVNVFRVGRATAGLKLFLPKTFLPIAIFLKARKLIISNKYDLVYVLQASQAGGAGWLLKMFHVLKQPLVINFQEGKDFSKQSFLTKLSRKVVIGSADYFTVISTYLKEFLITQGVSQDQIFVLPNGVTTSVVRNHSQSLRDTLGLGSEKIVITVSRLVEKNGLADLIRAMIFVRDNYSEPVKLLIVGDAEPQISLGLDLKGLAQSLGLTSEVIFVGAVENNDVPSYLSLADVFVRPSYSEGLGVSFLEAMASGVPIIATKVGGIVDFLEEGQTGLYCAVGDSQDIGRKIIKVLSDKELHEKLSKNGQDLVKEKYDWDIIANKFRNIYESITVK